MTTNKHPWMLTIFLIIVVCANLLNVTSVRADGENPTEPPAPTEVQSEPPVESTPEPVDSTPASVETEATPMAEALNQVPENTEIVVLDEEGNSVPLATQEASEIIEIVDPMWCPAGVLPGGAGCSMSFGTISALVNNMRDNAANYDENGIIYFTTDPGTQSFSLTDAIGSLGTSYDTLKNYNLTLQGGWDGVSTAYSGQTNFTTRPLTIGTSVNPWVGSLTLNDFVFSSSSSTSVTVYTTTGNITLNNVDVNNQAGGKNTALLDTASGNITVSNGTYDGNNSNSAGFSATTDSGSITISNTSFTENKTAGSTSNFDGATLSAPTVTLTSVTATGNDGNGITVNNVNVVTLNNVIAGANGTDVTPVGLANNVGSGIFINGNAGSNVFINGGSFSDNQKYGIEVGNTANTTLRIVSNPTCTGNVWGCSNGSFVVDTTPPTLSLPANITTPATGPAGAVVPFAATATDNVDPSVSVVCSPASGSTFPVGATTVICSATDTAGNNGSGSFLITVVDTTVVVPTSTSVPAPVSSTPAASTSPSSTTGSSTSHSASSAVIIPLTGGEVIDLNCDSVFSAFGIKLTFVNLCDYQTTLNKIDANTLPGGLPSDYTFVMGLELNILSENQTVDALPTGTGVQMDFPISGGSKEQFAVLYWNGSAWTEISQQVGNGEISDSEFYRILTDNTGVFVLVKK